MIAKWTTGGDAAVPEAPERRGEAPDAAPSGRLDSETLEMIRDLGRESGSDVLQQVVAVFLDSGDERLQEILHGVEEGELGKVQKLAHALRGGASQLGAVVVGGLCQDLEDAARQGDGGRCRSLWESLASEYRLAAVELRREAGL